MFVVLLSLWIYARIVSTSRLLEKSVFSIGMIRKSAASLEKRKKMSRIINLQI